LYEFVCPHPEVWLNCCYNRKKSLLAHHYKKFRGVGEVQTLTTIDQKFMHDQLLEIFRNNESGEFLVAGIKDIKFEFDVVNGTIEARSLQEISHLNISYNPSMFEKVKQASATVMILLAEREFLFGLIKLGDEDINRVVRQSKIDSVKSMQEMHNEISRVLVELRKVVKPTSGLRHLFSTGSEVSEQKQHRLSIYRALQDNISKMKSVSHAREILVSLEYNQKASPARPMGR